MKPRERVMLALRHKEPDRVPLFYRDVPEIEERLLKDLNLKDREELLTYLSIDFRWVGPKYIGPPLEDKDGVHKLDIWGVKYKYMHINEKAGYWETISNPLKDINDPKILEEYSWPKLEWFDFSHLKKEVDGYKDYAIMTSPGFSSPGILQYPIQNLLGVEKAFVDMYINPKFFDALTQHVLDFRLPFIERMLLAAGERIDFFRIGDDYGGQNNLLLSPELWRKRVKPALRSMADIAKKHRAYYYQHSCGSIRPLIPDFIEMGLDVLDPIQVAAKDMNPAELKKEFGCKLCFSGGVDEQNLLRTGSTDDVRNYVKKLLDIMAPGGGFFIGPTHNFQVDISTSNIVAMYEAARDWYY